MGLSPRPPRDRRVDTNHRAILRDRAGGEMDAFIVNMSRNGFRASTNRPLAVGDHVVVCSLEGELYPAVIRWAMETEAGGEFLVPSRLPEDVGRLGEGS